jgi:hypothetical protein
VVNAKCDTRSAIVVSFRPPRDANAMDPHNQPKCKRQYHQGARGAPKAHSGSTRGCKRLGGAEPWLGMRERRRPHLEAQVVDADSPSRAPGDVQAAASQLLPPLRGPGAQVAVSQFPAGDRP